MKDRILKILQERLSDVEIRKTSQAVFKEICEYFTEIATTQKELKYRFYGFNGDNPFNNKDLNSYSKPFTILFSKYKKSNTGNYDPKTNKITLGVGDSLNDPFDLSFLFYNNKSTFIHEFTHMLDYKRTDVKMMDISWGEELEDLSERFNKIYLTQTNLVKKIENVIKKNMKFFDKYRQVKKSNVYLSPNMEFLKHSLDNETYRFYKLYYRLQNAELNARFHQSMSTVFDDMQHLKEDEKCNKKRIINMFLQEFNKKLGTWTVPPKIKKKYLGRFYEVMKEEIPQCF